MSDDEEQLGEPGEVEVAEAEFKMSPANVELTEREIRAVELRKAGHSFFEIAQALGYQTKGAAWRAVRRALQRWGAENVQELRQLEIARLDTITRKLWPKILGQKARAGGVDDDGNIVEPREEIPPDMDAMRLYLQVSQRRSRLLGLDAPMEVTLPGAEEYQSTVQPVLDDVEDYMRLVDAIAEGEVIDVEAVDGDDGGGSGRGEEEGSREGEAAAEDPVLPSRSDDER